MDDEERVDAWLDERDERERERREEGVDERLEDERLELEDDGES